MHTRLVLPLAIVAASSLAVTAQLARAQDNARPTYWHDLPAVIENDGVFVNVTFGRPGLWFMLDSGCPYTIIDDRLAADLKLEVLEQREEGALSSKYVRDVPVFIDGNRVIDSPLMVMPVDSNTSKRVGRRISGILGFDYLFTRVIMIDYQHGQVKEHSIEKFLYTGPGEIVPVGAGRDRHAYVMSVITPLGDQPHGITLAVDTGLKGCIDLPSKWAKWLDVPSSTQPVLKNRVTTMYGDTEQVNFLLGHLKVGSFEIDQPAASVGVDLPGPPSGLIGTDFLDRFTVIFDLARGRIILEPNDQLKNPRRSAWLGFSVAAEGDDFATFRVDYVDPNSPGAQAGLEVNDILTAIGVRAVAGLKLHELRKIFDDAVDQPLPVTISRNGVPVDLTITSHDFVTQLQSAPAPKNPTSPTPPK